MHDFNITNFLILHLDENIKNFDNLFVISKGQICEYGNESYFNLICES